MAHGAKKAPKRAQRRLWLKARNFGGVERGQGAKGGPEARRMLKLPAFHPRRMERKS